MLQFLEDVFPGPDIGRVPTEGEAGGPVCEAIVVLGREHQVPEGNRLSFGPAWLMLELVSPCETFEAILFEIVS